MFATRLTREQTQSTWTACPGCQNSPPLPHHSHCPLGNSSSSGDAFRWDCVFLPDSGAFFVNYVITAGLVGCGLELLRAPELFIYALFLCWYCIGSLNS